MEYFAQKSFCALLRALGYSVKKNTKKLFAITEFNLAGTVKVKPLLLLFTYKDASEGSLRIEDFKDNTDADKTRLPPPYFLLRSTQSTKLTFGNHPTSRLIP